jgi:hypothetical protein
MDQHVVSAWHLRAFAQRVVGVWTIHVYDKVADAFVDASVKDFLAETDVHSTEVEQGLGSIEGPAAEAALKLAKFAKPLPAGLYAVVDPNDRIRTEGPPLADRGVIAGMRLMVSEHQVPSPTPQHRLSLATYAGLMYMRAPKVERALLEFSRVYDAAAQLALDRLLPGMRAELQSDLNSLRGRMLLNARTIGAQLARANWWILRSEPQKPFILGDNPVVTTVSLGHDDSWRPILSDASYLVGIALGPSVALLIAPQRFFPITDVGGPEDAARAINRLTWRSAGRYVLARDRATLDSALSIIKEDARRATIPVDFDPETIHRSATRDVERIASQLTWMQMLPGRHWEGCRLVFGYPSVLIQHTRPTPRLYEH